MVVAGSVLLFYNKTKFVGGADWLSISDLDGSLKISAANGRKPVFVSQIIIIENLGLGVLSKSRVKASSFTFVNKKIGNLWLFQTPSYYDFN